MITILVPTYNRAHRLESVRDNISRNTAGAYELKFCVEEDDQDSIAAVRSLSLEPSVNRRTHNYAGAVNSGFEDSCGDYIFCGSDDLNFHPDWDRIALAKAPASVIGTRDLTNPDAERGTHATHYLVSRTYIETFGGVIDEAPGKVIHEGYIHGWTDTEFIETAKYRGVFEPCMDAVVEHMHWFFGKAQLDDTYIKSRDSNDADSRTFYSREHLWHGDFRSYSAWYPGN